MKLQLVILAMQNNENKYNVDFVLTDQTLLDLNKCKKC